MEMFSNFLLLAEAVIAAGGTVAFEWPRYCQGWAQKPLQEFIQKHNLHEALFDGCGFGMLIDGHRVRKPWRVVTTDPLLAENLSKHACKGGHVHTPIQGALTAKSAFYNRAMCECILGSLLFRIKLPCTYRLCR